MAAGNRYDLTYRSCQEAHSTERILCQQGFDREESRKLAKWYAADARLFGRAKKRRR